MIKKTNNSQKIFLYNILIFGIGLILVIGNYKLAAKISYLKVEVVSDSRGLLGIFPDCSTNCSKTGSTKRSIEVLRRESFRLRLQNKSNEHIGVIVAIDGKNIISGLPSELKFNESMYVLPPFSSGSVSGWRKGINEIQRFYFTDEFDYCRGAWGNLSREGIITIAVFLSQEKHYYHRIPLKTAHLLETSIDNDKNSIRAIERNVNLESWPSVGRGAILWEPVNLSNFLPETQPVEIFHIYFRWKHSLELDRLPDTIYFHKEIFHSSFR